MQRRQLLGGLAGLLILGPAWVPAMAKRRALTEMLTESEVETLRSDWQNWLPASAQPDLSLTKLELDKAQWRERLSDAAFDVLRREGTERAGSHHYNQEERDGVYACAGCELPLFTSAMKYESGTGWPSFFTHIPDHLETKTDYKLIWPRTEYHCVRCGGHQGHVFGDGPTPTGQRWCNNGVALTFQAKQG